MHRLILTKYNIVKVKFSYIINQILYSVFSFSVSFFAIRILSVKDFGDFSYAYSFIPLLNIIPLAFVYFPMMNFYSKWKNKELEYVFSNLTISFVLSLFLSAILVIILYLTDTITGKISLFILFYFFYQSYEFVRRLFIARQEIQILNKFELIKFTVFITLIGGLIFFDLTDIKNILVVLILVFIIVNCISYFFSRIKIVRKSYLSQVVHESYSFGSWILLSNLVQNLSSNFFIYLSGIILASESVAMLTAPKVFLGVTTVFLLSMDNYYTPKLALKRSNYDITFSGEFKSLIKELRIFYLIFFLISILMIYFQDYVIGIAFGSKYTQGENYLWGFLIVGLFYSIMRPFLILFRVFENTKFLFTSSLWVLIFVLICTYPVMKIYGALGGIIIMILGNLLQLIIFIFYLKGNDKNIFRNLFFRTK